MYGIYDLRECWKQVLLPKNVELSEIKYRALRFKNIARHIWPTWSCSGKVRPPAEAIMSAGNSQRRDTTPSGDVELWHTSCSQDLFRLFIHEHLDQPLKSEKFSFPQSETYIASNDNIHNKHVLGTYQKFTLKPGISSHILNV